MRPKVSSLSTLPLIPALLAIGGPWSLAADARPTPERPPTIQDEDAASEDRARLERDVVRAFSDDRPADALRRLDEAIARWPDRPEFHYGRACALALLDRRDEAGASLLAAVRNGFRDFDVMRLDPALRSMRDHEVYLAIIEAEGRPTPAKGATDAPALAARFGDDYHVESIEGLRIHLACGVPRRSCHEMTSMLRRQSDHQRSTLFTAADPDWCTIIVPAARDQATVFRRDLGLEDPDRTPGAYRHDRRLLVSRDVGSSMRHEYTHRLHWADMDARRQRHPMWIQEGIASLFEDYEWRSEGGIVFTPNLRHAIVHRQVSTGRDLPLTAVMAMEPEDFREDRSALYPQVRSVFEFIADRGRLETWYRTYVATHDEDRSGRLALERTFGRSIDQIHELWRRWVLDRGRRESTLQLGDPYPGVLVEEAGDGVRIQRVLTMEARRSGLRVGDVVTRIGEASVPTRTAWFLALERHRLGDVVRLEYRRRGTVKAVRVRLHPFGSR